MSKLKRGDMFLYKNDVYYIDAVTPSEIWLYAILECGRYDIIPIAKSGTLGRVIGRMVEQPMFVLDTMRRVNRAKDKK